MTKPNLTISELDAERLDRLLEQPAFAGTLIVQALNEELESCRDFALRGNPVRCRYHEQSGMLSRFKH